jgi:hypothetical protein
MNFRHLFLLIPVIGVIAFFSACAPKNQEIIQLPDGTQDIVTYKMTGDSIKIGNYSNGNIYFKSHKKNGLKGFTETETFTYFPNGQVRRYAYLVNDSLRYYRFYKKEGALESSGGCALVYLDNETLYVDTLVVNEPYFHQLRFATPPNTRFRLLYGDEVEDENNRDINANPLKMLPVKNNMTGFLVKYDAVGQYNKVLYWSLEDTVKGGIEKGVVWRRFEVKSE